MSAAPALDLQPKTNEETSGGEARESGEFSIEKAFAEKGGEGLEKLAGSEVARSLERIKALAEVPAEVAATAMELIAQLKALKEQTEADLLASKKKLDMALGKVSTPNKGGDVKKTDGPAILQETQTTAEPEAPDEREAIALTKIKSIPVPEEATTEEMVIEPSKIPGAEEAAKIEAPTGRKDAHEELEVTEKDKEPILSDWEALTAEEMQKKAAAEQDYEEAQKALSDFKAQRNDSLTPIEQKYVLALEAQLEMDRLAAAHAENQIALYDANEGIERLSAQGENAGGLDSLIEQRNAKDLHSKNLAAQFEEAAKHHDDVLAEYESALEDFTEEAAGEGLEGDEKEDEKNEAPMENVDTEKSTGGSFGGGGFERPLHLSEEDEANFEARQAGVGDEKKAGVFSRMWRATKNQGKAATHPAMKLGGAGDAKKKKDKKDKKGFFKWFFSDKWLP